MENKIKFILFGLLASYLAKSLILTTNLNEVLIIAILAGLTAFYELKLNKKDVKLLQDQIDSLMEDKTTQNKSIDDLKSSIVSVKVSSGIRGLTNK